MRLILCGKGTAAAEALEYLVAQGDEVWAIATAGDQGEDGWQRSYRRAALDLGVRVDQPPKINAPDVVRRLQEFGASALLSIQYDQILHGNLFRSVGCPCLNLHFALLPRHRGVAPIAWAILAGDAEAGVTLHHMVEDIDAGDIIARRAVPIPPDGTARDLYDDVSRAAVALFEESYPFSPELLATRLHQASGQAVYHRTGEFDFSKRRVDWNQPADALHRWVRAMIFPPMQYPEAATNGRLLSITRLAGALGDVTSAHPGVVVGRFRGGVEVAAADRSLRICGMIDPAAPDASAEHVLDSLAVGDQLE